MRSPDITHTEEKEEFLIPHGDHSIPDIKTAKLTENSMKKTYLEKTTVLALLLGLASLANTTPAMQAWI